MTNPDRREQMPLVAQDTRPFRNFIRAFCTVIIAAALKTVVDTLAADGHQHDGIHALLLGGIEALAAAAFLVARLRRVAGAVLFLVFATATALTLQDGEWPLHLLFYGYTVIFILTVDRHAAGRNAA